MELIDSGFFSLKMKDFDILMNRPSLLWKLRRKVGKKCLKACKNNKNVEDVSKIIGRYTNLCGRGRKNREIVDIIVGGIKLLVELDKKELALLELEKNTVLNIKEKQNLKQELNLEA